MKRPHSAFACCIKDIRSWDKEDLKNLVKEIPKGMFNYNKYVKTIDKRMGVLSDIGDYLYQLPYLKVIFVPLFALLLLILLLIADIIIIGGYYISRITS